MNTKLLLLILIIAGFSSCSTAYKAGQTPDDVYYSPVRPQNDYVRVENDEDKNVYNNSTDEDRNIRRSIHNRRLRRYHDYDYDYGYGVPYGNQYPPVYIDPKTGVTTPATKPQPRKYNLGAYKKPTNNTTQSTDPNTVKTGNQTPTNTTAPVRTFPKQSTTKSGTGVGNFLREVFSGAGVNNNDNSSSTRTFNNTNNSNNNSSNNNSNNSNNSGNSGKSSSSSSSGSSAPVRTFDKNN